ncbi:GW dipeptide domain-containing protein [Desemzia sp. FAM 24101]|uniref:GW dipeptide domain-containing protein n=1 Tax=unclassified Desemzia TaxID=2685243 RepID=UPI0038880D3C
MSSIVLSIFLSAVAPTIVLAEGNNSNTNKELVETDITKQDEKDNNVEIKKDESESSENPVAAEETILETKEIDNTEIMNSSNETSEQESTIDNENETKTNSKTEEATTIDNETEETEAANSEKEEDSTSAEENETEEIKENVFSLEENRELAMKIMEEEINKKNKISLFSTNSIVPTTVFINSIASAAVNMGNQYGLYPSVIMAQAILESGWGNSSLSKAPNYNLFGIKAENGYTGNFVTVDTKEWVKDQNHKDGGYYITISAKFRKYSSYTETFKDHALFLKKDRYQKVWLKNAGTYQEATKALSDAGYATDPEYASKLNSIIASYDLQNYDLWEQTNYNTVITKSGISIDSLPWGIKGFEKIASSSDFVGIEAQVTKKTHNGAYAFIVVNGEEIGWINSQALNLFETNIVAYNAIIKKTSISIDTIPYGIPGYKKVSSSTDHLGKELQVTRKTKDGEYVYLLVDGKGLGWINKNAIQQFKTKTLSYTGIIAKNSISIDSLPWGTFGYKKIASSSDYTGKELQITRETEDGKYIYILTNGKNIGWIDKNSIKQFLTKTVSYTAFIAKERISIDSLPWGTFGYKKIASTSDYKGKEINVTREMSNGDYVYISVDGKEIGWINKNSLQTLKSEIKPYTIRVNKKSISIDTLPWGTLGYTKVASSSDYLGKEVKIIKETSDNKYAYISIEGKNIGWIDRKALQ